MAETHASSPPLSHIQPQQLLSLMEMEPEADCQKSGP